MANEAGARPIALRPSSPQLLPLSAAAPLRLDGHPGALLVVSGSVDLFAVTLTAGEPRGPRYPLFRLSADELMLGLPAGGDHAVIAVAHRDTAVRPLMWDDLAAWPEAAHVDLVEQWVGRLAAALFGEAPVWSALAGEPGTICQLDAGAQLHAARGVTWVVPQRGRLKVHDRPEGVDQILPIAAGLSLRAETEAEMHVVAGADALSAGSAVLDPFHRLILASIGDCVARAQEESRRRILARGDADRRSAGWGFRQLARLADSAVAEPLETISSDPTLAVLRAVAGRLGMELTRIPRQHDSAQLSVRSITRSNGVGLRSVLLRGMWWRSDVGALLGWRGKPGDRRPVALLPAGGRRTELWDPSDGRTVAIDEAIASEMAPHAEMLYRPFPPRLRTFLELIRFAASGSGRELATICGAAALSCLVAVLFPIAAGFLFESVVPRAETTEILAVVAGLALAAIGACTFDLSKAIALLRLESLTEAALQPALMQRLMGLPVNFFRDYGIGDLTDRVLSIQTVRRLLADNSLLTVLSALFSVLSLVVIFLYSASMALVAAGLVGVAALISGMLAAGELRQLRARIELRGQEDSLVLQIIEGIAKLRVAAGETRVFAIWAALFVRQKRRFLAGQRYALLGDGFAEVYSVVALLALFYTASRLLIPAAVDAGEAGQPGEVLGLGAFLAINAAFGQLLAAMRAMTRGVATLLGIVPLFERMQPIIAAVPELRADKAEARILSGRVELSHVTFRYVAGVRPIFDDLSLTIEAGSLVALVGPSGSGKSTLLRLLLGFETAESGDILYDGQSIGRLDTTSLRRQMGVVLQNGRVTTGTIFDNITSGLPYRLEDAWEAARLAGVADDIEAMPMGMHTLLIEGASTLSGGQRQRLMIARALIGRPRILLFDEATSALDNRTQALVMQSLARLRTTRIIIAHRLSTVERADRIFVLDAGRSVESGNYAELMAKKGLFYRLAQRQVL